MDSNLLKTFLIPEENPYVAADAYIAPGAIVAGAVTLAPLSSVWFGAVLRGDINRISVGARSNIQDGCVVHVSDDCAAVIGCEVTVGHRAIVHACTVGDGVLVGMGAVLLDGCRIGAESIIAAGALVPKGMAVPEGALVMGSPARVKRLLSAQERAANRRLAAKYVEVARRYRALGLAGAPWLPGQSSVAMSEKAS